LRQGLDYLLFPNLIASVFLVILAEPMTRLLFERGAVGLASTAHVSIALACLAPGLLAFSSVNILARAFYALGDTKTPMRVSVFCLIVNILFVVLLVERYRAAGLGLANTATSFLNAGLLVYALRRKLGRLELGSLVNTIMALAPAALLAGMTAWWLSHVWEAQLGHQGLLLKLGAVFAPMIPATMLYWVVAWWMGATAARDIATLLINRLRPGTKA
jgi:putative peptidoglycan lipid II flippase